MDDQHLHLRSVELHILLSVVDRPRHGYAILQEAEERTDGRPGFEIPTLYRALRRLREADLIRIADPPEPDPGERREYWEATELGRRALEAELTRLEAAVAVGRARMGSTSALRATVGKQARAGGGK
jgi:DNA-binding PadR family transcriptional regulator